MCVCVYGHLCDDDMVRVGMGSGCGGVGREDGNIYTRHHKKEEKSLRNEASA